MIIDIIFSRLYSFLNKKGLVVKLPESVPPKVAESMSPTFIAIILFTTVFLTRVAFSFTEYGDYFTAINTVIGAPILRLGANPTSAVIFLMLTSARSEEHTSELQSRGHLVCRLLLEKKNEYNVYVIDR